jgi:hypothetical protein
MHILFPGDPIQRSRCDPDFCRELEHAALAGFTALLYSHEALMEGDVDEALGGIRYTDCVSQRPVLLRGWMIPGEVYTLLYEALITRGYCFFVNPVAYEEAHYLPFAIRHLGEHTARSAWMEGDDPEAAWEMYQPFAEEAAIIKDWVKSAKHRWKEACYIPAGTGKDRFLEIFSAFRSARGGQFNRGVVIRRFHQVVKRGSDIRGFPVNEEYRLFFWRGQLVAHTPSVTGADPLEKLALWRDLAMRFASPFITMDIALQTDGSWFVVEVGDGGVSGLPMGVEELRFYAALWNHASSEPVVR